MGTVVPLKTSDSGHSSQLSGVIQAMCRLRPTRSVNLCRRRTGCAILKNSFVRVLRFCAMSKIFISHSSLDNGPAIAIAEWLQENGWDEYFLDLEPERGIAAGERWERALYQAATRCEAVLFLISRNWLASPWCLREMELAYKLNKHIFAVLIDDTPRATVPKTIAPWQMANLHRGQDHIWIEVKLPDQRITQVTFSRAGLATLKEGLRRAQIDPIHFVWPPENEPDRAPWRGLEPLESRDAGIFFGRDGQIIAALDKIRALREAAPPRLMAIIGASGAGKSSFLRAGLIPRLKRDDHNYLVLPVIRPEGGGLKAFTASLGQTALDLKLGLAQHDIGKAVSQAAEGNSDELSALLTRMAEAARPPMIDGEAAPPPAIVLPIDQGEELFHSSGRAEGSTFLSLLAQLLRLDQPRLLALVTIRSDSYDLLQRARELEDIRHEAFSLPPLARGNYVDVIRRPLEVLNRHLGNSGQSLKFDPAIIERLTATLDEGDGRDALPLLAFTLARLYRDFHARGDITVADYDAMGGIGGSIDAAVDSALARAAEDRRTADGTSLGDMLRQTMIPRFAGIDPETRTARRRAASYDALPTEALPLVDALIAERLLTRDNGTVEPAHEALLREWKGLTHWLAEDREQLIALEGVRRATVDWQANGRHKDYLAHREGRLASAEGLAHRSDLWSGLGDTDRTYMRACREAEDDENARRKADLAAREAAVRKGRRAVKIGATVAVALLLVSAGLGWFAWGRDKRAQQAEMDALALLALSRAESNPVDALKLVLGAWPKSKDGTFPKPFLAFNAISTAMTRTRPHVLVREPTGLISSIAISPDGRQVAIGNIGGVLQLWDTASGQWDNILTSNHSGSITRIIFSPDGRLIISGDENGTIVLWNAVTHDQIGAPALHHNYPITSLAFPIGDSARMVTGDAIGTLAFWGIEEGGLKSHRILPTGETDSAPITSISFSPDGMRTAIGDHNGTINIWDMTTHEQIGKTIRPREPDPSAIIKATLSNNGNIITSVSQVGEVRTWDWETGAATDEPIKLTEDWGSYIYTEPYGEMFAECNGGREVLLGNIEIGEKNGKLLVDHEESCSDLIFSSDGKTLLGLYQPRYINPDDTREYFDTLRLWDIHAGRLIASATGGDIDANDPASLNVVKFTTSGDRIIAGDHLGRIHIMHPSTRNFQVEKSWLAHNGEVNGIFTFPGSQEIGTFGAENIIDGAAWKLWDTHTGSLQAIQEAGKHSFFSPDGTHSISGNEYGALHLRRTDSGDGEDFHGHEVEIREVIFSTDGNYFVSKDRRGILRFWGVDGRERTKAPLDCDSYFSFSADSTHVACGSEDGELRFWDIETGARANQRIFGDEHKIISVSFSEDGRRIATGDAFGHSRLFDARTGAQIGGPMRLTQHTVTNISLPPNGMEIATYTIDEILTLWDVSYPLGNILQVACHYLPVIDGRPDTSTDGLTAGIVNRELSLPSDCDNYDPPLPPEYRR